MHCPALPSTDPPASPAPLLQCLYANPAFRQAVYGVRQPLADEPIVKELRWGCCCARANHGCPCKSACLHTCLHTCLACLRIAC